MRRPLSIMRVDREAGWIELLYKIHGHGLQHLAARRVGDIVNLLGPIGQGFTPHPERPRALLIGGGVGIPPMVFLAETLRDRAAEGFQPFAILGSELPFPFRARPSTIMVPGMPDGVIACMPLLDDWGVPSRLTTQVGISRAATTAMSRTSRACGWRRLDAATLRAGGDLRLRPHADAAARWRRWPREFDAALPGLAGGIHGLRGGRLRRLRGRSADPGRAGHEAGLRGRAGVRRAYGIRRHWIISAA